MFRLCHPKADRNERKHPCYDLFRAVNYQIDCRTRKLKTAMLPSLSELSTAVLASKTHKKNAEGGAEYQLLDLLRAYPDIVRAIIDQDLCNVTGTLSSTSHQNLDTITEQFLLDESFWGILTGAWRKNAPWTCIMDEAPDQSVAREFTQLMSQAKENPKHFPKREDVRLIIQNGIQYVASRFAGEALPAPGENGANGEPPPRISEFWTEDFAQSHDVGPSVSGKGEGKTPPYPLRWTDGPNNRRTVWARSLEPAYLQTVDFKAVCYNNRNQEVTLTDRYFVTQGPKPPVLGGTLQTPENNAHEDPTGPLLKKYKKLLGEYQRAQSELTGENRAADLATSKQTMESWKSTLLSERMWLLKLFCDGIRKRQAIMVALCVVVDQIVDFDASCGMEQPPWQELFRMVHTKVGNQHLQPIPDAEYHSWQLLRNVYPQGMGNPNDIPWGWAYQGDRCSSISAKYEHQPTAYALETAAKRFVAQRGIDKKFKIGVHLDTIDEKKKKHNKQYFRVAALLNAVFEEKYVMQMHDIWYDYD